MKKEYQGLVREAMSAIESQKIYSLIFEIWKNLIDSYLKDKPKWLNDMSKIFSQREKSPHDIIVDLKTSANSVWESSTSFKIFSLTRIFISIEEKEFLKTIMNLDLTLPQEGETRLNLPVEKLLDLQNKISKKSYKK